MKKTFKALNITIDLMFFGSDKEIEHAEELENKRMQEIESIIFDPAFKTIDYYTSYNQHRILHRSTRQGVLFQLSYIDADNIPSMHENYIKTSDFCVNECIHTKDDLLRHFLNESNFNDLIVNIERN